MDGSLPGSSVHGILQVRILEWITFLLQGIFPTKGPNPGLLHCRQILYCLSHQGNLPLFMSTWLCSSSFPVLPVSQKSTLDIKKETGTDACHKTEADQALPLLPNVWAGLRGFSVGPGRQAMGIP